MPQVQILRAFVQQRLNAAAEEIFEVFQRTIVEYEETLCRQGKLLDAVFKPQVRLHRPGVQLMSVSNEDVSTEQQEWNFSLDQSYPPELPHIKEEQEALWTGRGEQLQRLEEAQITKFTPKPVLVKNEEEEKPQSSQLHHTEQMKTEADGDDSEGPEPHKNFNPDHLQHYTIDELSHSSEPETEDGFNWEETSGPLSGLDPLRNNQGPERHTGKSPRSSSECSTSSGYKRRQQKQCGTQTGVKEFSCSVCGKKYAWQTSLYSHMRLHSEGKSSSCPVCQKVFPHRVALMMHMRVHTGEKPFSCSVCGRRFTQKGALKGHMRIHTGEKPYSCSVCDKSFMHRDYLRQHKCDGERIEHK